MFRQSFAIVFISLAMICQTAYGDTHPTNVLNNFNKSIEGRKLVAEVQTEVETVLADNQDSPSTAITESLIVIYPEFGQAIDDADFEDLATAVAALTPLTTHEDRFLAADASFYLARTLMNGEKFEEAVPLLDALTGELGEHSAQQGVAQYYTGVAQAGLLDNTGAIKAFITFLQSTPDAPERLRDNAVTQIQELQTIAKGKLTDIRQRMDFSRRRLELTKTDEDTQGQQQQIVAMLGKLIKEEEKKEQSQQSSGKPKDKPEKKENKENSGDNQKKPEDGKGKPGPSKSQSGSSSSNPNGVAELKTYEIWLKSTTITPTASDPE